MHAEPRCGPLPLADALIEWSDPALIDAIRAEEARFEPGRLEELGLFTLDDVRHFRRTPARPYYRPPSLNPTAALDRAWERLFSAFRRQVERGEVQLWGTQVGYFRDAVPEDLPGARAAAFAFDAAAGAVFLELTTYVGVTAARKDPGAARDTAEVDARPRLGLREALLEWADRDLVQAVKRLEWLVAGINRRRLARPALRGEADAQPALATFSAAEALAPEKALSAARDALYRDFRQRIERNELLIVGVQTWPLPETERKAIPGVWASEFWFDLEANQIRIVQFNRTTRIFAAAVVSLSVARSQPAHCAAHAAPSAEPDAATQAPDPGATTDPPGAPRSAAEPLQRAGRENYGPIIEAGLREHWDDLFPNGPPVGVPIWSDLARRLFRRITKRAAGDMIKVPQEETIRTRLPTIYQRVLSEKASEGQSAQ